MIDVEVIWYENYCIDILKDIWALCDVRSDVSLEKVWIKVVRNYCVYIYFCEELYCINTC